LLLIIGLECKETPTGDSMTRVATAGAKALKKVHGTSFVVGSIVVSFNISARLSILRRVAQLTGVMRRLV
jgi:hypothetical protein